MDTGRETNSSTTAKNNMETSKKKGKRRERTMMKLCIDETNSRSRPTSKQMKCRHKIPKNRYCTE